MIFVRAWYMIICKLKFYHACNCWALIGAPNTIFTSLRWQFKFIVWIFTSIIHSVLMLRLSNLLELYRMKRRTSCGKTKSSLIICKEWNRCQVDLTACVTSWMLQALEGNGIKFIIGSPFSFFFCFFSLFFLCVYIMIWCKYIMRN